MISFGVDAPAILGVMEVGVFFSLVMFGVVALQGYVYFQKCHADRTGLKLLVGLVLFLELCHSIASCQSIYYFTINLAGVPELQKPANSYALSLTPVFETIITAMVQSFFTYRIRVLSGSVPLSAFCWALCLLRFIGGMAMSAVAILDVRLEPDYFHLQDTYGWLITSALNVGAITDVVICVAMCKYLKRMYSAYNFPRSEKLIHRLVSWTIQTGLITSMTSVVVVISFQTMKHNPRRASINRPSVVWLALYTFLAKSHREIILAEKSSSGSSHLSKIVINIKRTTTVTSTSALDQSKGLRSSKELPRVPEKAVYNHKAYISESI